MKVLVIDPVTATIREEEWGKNVGDVFKWVRSDILEQIPCIKGRTLLVDAVEDEAVMAPKWFIPDLFPLPLSGAGVLTLTSEDVPSEVREEMMAKVRWGLLFNPHGPMAGSA